MIFIAIGIQHAALVSTTIAALLNPRVVLVGKKETTHLRGGGGEVPLV